MAALISAEIGAPISFAKMAQVRLPLTMMSAFCGIAGWLRMAAGPSGVVRQGHSDQEATGRCRRRGGAVEYAAVPDCRQGHTGAAGRVLGGAQTGARVGARCAAARRLVAEADLPPGCAQCGAGRARGRRAAGEPRRRGQGLVHRIHGGRAPGRARLCGGAQAGQPRTRRQVGGDRARRRRPVGRGDR